MKKISNIYIQDYLELNHVLPEYVVDKVAYYRKTKEFYEVYDRYIIIRDLNKRRKSYVR